MNGTLAGEGFFPRRLGLAELIVHCSELLFGGCYSFVPFVPLLLLRRGGRHDSGR